MEFIFAIIAGALALPGLAVLYKLIDHWKEYDSDEKWQLFLGGLVLAGIPIAAIFVVL